MNVHDTKTATGILYFVAGERGCEFMKNHNVWLNTSVLGCSIYLAIFVLWRKIQPEGVLFYQGLFLVFFVSALQYLIQSKVSKVSNVIRDAVITFFACYSFMLTFPTTVDRSYSVRMILELQKYPDGLTRSQIENYFTNDFIIKGGIEKRIAEQLASGIVVEHETRFQLTSFGELIADSFHWTRQVFSSQTADP